MEARAAWSPTGYIASSATTSACPGMWLPIAGRPRAIASRTALGSPSLAEGMTNASLSSSKAQRRVPIGDVARQADAPAQLVPPDRVLDRRAVRTVADENGGNGKSLRPHCTAREHDVGDALAAREGAHECDADLRGVVRRLPGRPELAPVQSHGADRLPWDLCPTGVEARELRAVHVARGVDDSGRGAAGAALDAPR